MFDTKHVPATQTTMPQIDTVGGSPSAADSAGLIASIACAIHCAAMPLVIGYLPMLGLSWLADPSFHRVMAFVCFGLALSAFIPGWRRHGSLAPTLFGAVGVGLLSFAAFGLECECCPSSVAATSSPEPVSSCSDPGCPSCQATEAEYEPIVAEATTDEVAVAVASAPLAWVIPFVTPLGGVFLVAGHVSNHRQSCACCRKEQCEGKSAPTEDNPLA